MANIVEEFKTFAVKGNAVDMAVGVILGAAFNKVVNSIVTDILMPPIGMAIGGVEFKHLKFVLKEPQGDIPGVFISYGSFVNSVVEFLIVAFTLFMVVKVMNRLIAKREEEVKAA